jgi:O-antigen ligase
LIARWSNALRKLAARPASDWLSLLGIWLCSVSLLVIITNQYGALIKLDPYYRIHTPALCLAFGLVVAAANTRLAIMATVFLLPLLPTFAWQFQLYTGYGRIQDVHGAGLDLIAGVFLGTLVRSVLQQNKATDSTTRKTLSLSWPAALAFVVISISVAIAIARNLQQSNAPFSLSALLFNLLHLRTLTWHDDYRPLMDWVAYGGAFSIVAMFAPALKNMPDRNDVIFKPLIVGLVVAALVGSRQSAFGAGLNVDLQNFRLDRFGFAALGFQPDLHAFAGHMLLGAVGLAGYAFYKRSQWLWLLCIGLVSCLCWWLLFLSKSKASLALAFLCLVLFAVLWLTRRLGKSTHLLTGLGCVGALLLISIPIAPGLWAAGLTQIMHALGLPDLLALNIRLSYRPEVYMAAFRMFALFPFAGLGQAEFYRQSANPELSRSFFLSTEQNGENAHNYFLQTLVETGLIGFVTLGLMLIYPFFKVASKRILIPALVALLAIACANVFSHSLLVRENLLLAACFVALLYSFIPTAASNSNQSVVARYPWNFLQQRYVIVAIVAISLALIVKEGLQSRGGFPFDKDLQCFKTRPLAIDGWTSGRYMTDIPVGAAGFTIQLATTQPDAEQRPISGSLQILFDRRKLIDKDFVLNKTGPQQLSFDLPAGTIATPDDYQVELTLSRCFIPRNFGMNEDSRRLGVRIEAIHWH